MRRRILMVLLGLGAIGGYASGIAHLRHGACGSGWRDRAESHWQSQGRNTNRDCVDHANIDSDERDETR